MMEINKIYCGDCLKIIKEIPDKSIDCIIADPPYGLNYFSNHYQHGNPFKRIENDDKLFIPINELWEKLKLTGAMYIFYSHKIPLIDKRIKNIIIWVKNNWSAGDLKGDYGNQYECLGFLPQKDFKLKGKRYSNVWNFDREIPKYHPTQKPLSIIKRILESSTECNNLVLDPFIGSGTTALAALQLNRNYIGIEINKEYVEIANKRIEDYKQQLKLELGVTNED